ncbi:MAG: hypothetical protein ABW082_00445 [Sedimenticola sp.]
MSLTALLVGLSGCASTYVDERTRSPHFRDGQFRNGIESEKSWWSFPAVGQSA